MRRLIFTGDATFVRRLRDEIREEHASIIAEDSWVLTEAGRVLEFNTTDLRMIMNTPLVMLTDVQIDIVHVSDQMRGAACASPVDQRRGHPEDCGRGGDAPVAVGAVGVLS